MAKLKLTKTIVNGAKQLIGFMVEGKERDLGGFSDNIVERGYPIEYLIKTKFTNSQVMVSTKQGKNTLLERGTFKINSLPMLVFNKTGNPDTEYTPVDNSVEIVERFVQDNENVGFKVRFSDGSEDNLRYANVIMISKWFKPSNFSVRTSSKGKVYICGKQGGITLDELPATYLGEESKAKRTKSAAKEKSAAVVGSLESGFDILDIYDLINRFGGSIIKLASEDYEAHSEGAKEEAGEFTSLGIGEVASPNIKFNGTKLNVNAAFKKAGVVGVEIGGSKQSITTYVNRTKSIFVNGDNYIKKFGIAVQADKADALIAAIGKSLALEKITDTSITSPLSQVIDAKSLAFFTVDSSKIDPISQDKRKKSIMSAKAIAELCRKQYTLKLISKYLGPMGGVMKELKSEINTAEISEAKNRSLFGIYSMMNEEALRTLTEAGIDVYTGAYTKVGTASVGKGKSSGDKEVAIEITYTLDGMDFNKISGKDVKAAGLAGNTAKLPSEVIEIVSKIESIANPVDKYKAAYELYRKTEDKLDEINEKLWRHNSSMYLNGGKAMIHSHDKNKWVVCTSTRVKTAQVYESLEVEGLKVKFTGVSI